MAIDVRKLKDEVLVHLSKGKPVKALESLEALEKLEPNEGIWPQRIAECCRKVGRDDDAVMALERSAEKYAAAGFLVKAIAMCKLLLQIRPDHREAVVRLASLQASRGLPTVPTLTLPNLPAPLAAAPSGGSDEPIEVADSDVIPVEAEPRFPPGATLEAVSLQQLMPAAQERLTAQGEASGITDIPLELELEITELDPNDVGAIATSLEKTPLFSALSPQSFEQLVSKLSLVELSPGQELFQQGQLGKTLYVVAEGELKVSAFAPRPIELGRLREGAFVGEIAMVTEQPRTATVTAVEPTRVLAVEREHLGQAMQDEPGLLRVLLRFLRDRLINTLTATSPLFSPFSGEDRKQLAERFRFIEVKPSTRLIQEGERSPGLFIVLSGQVSVWRGAAHQPAELATLGPGNMFGEMSLLANEPAVASVTATRNSYLFELPRDVFREVIMTHPHVLELVGELANARREKLMKIQRGDEAYEELRLELF